MNSETPFEGDVPDGDDAPYEWLDEWLCEYVDGTMDPSLEAVFEQYVEANPELKAHIQRLQETRELLCECGLSKDPSSRVENKICTEVECDLLQSSAPVSEILLDRPLAAFGVASSVAVALVIGFLVGVTVVEPNSTFPTTTTTRTPVERVTGEYERASSSLLERVSPPSRSENPPLFRPSVPLSTSDSIQYSTALTTIRLP